MVNNLGKRDSVKAEWGSSVGSSVELMAMLKAGLERMRSGLDSGVLREFEEIQRLGSESKIYPHSSHYLAFIIAHLIGEGILPDRDWDLGQSVYEVRGKRLTNVLPRAGVALDALDPARFDVMELRREFHAGGPLNDPDAGRALLDAIDLLRSSFDRTDGGGALIVAF